MKIIPKALKSWLARREAAKYKPCKQYKHCKVNLLKIHKGKIIYQKFIWIDEEIFLKIIETIRNTKTTYD